MKKKLLYQKPKLVLRLPDLDHSKTAVLNTLGSQESQRSYRFAIEDFIAWYCSEPRLAFNKTVVLRYRLQLEARHLSASTINVRLAAVRRLAYKAADGGLLSPELAASIRLTSAVIAAQCRSNALSKALQPVFFSADVHLNSWSNCPLLSIDDLPPLCQMPTRPGRPPRSYSAETAASTRETRVSECSFEVAL